LNAFQPARGTLILLALVLAAIWFGNLDYRRLIRPDEGRYAEIAREMAVTGDWITPRLNGIKYFEKPPLQYWTTAASFRLFGEHEWTARLWAALTGLAGVFLVFLAGRRLFGPDAGFYSALVLAGSVGYVGAAHINTLDAGIAFFMTATLTSFLLARRTGASPAESRNWMLAAWAGAAFAVLSKGLIGIVLPAGTIALYVLLQRDFGLLRRLQWGAGVAVFLAIAVPWFVLVQIANPEFAQFFFVHEHFERFLTKVHRRAGPWWYYFPVLAAAMLPWLSMLPQAVAHGWRAQPPQKEFQPARFLVIWSAFIFAFFSASGSKLPSYVLPVVPALALLAGAWLAAVEGRRLLGHVIPVMLAGAALAAFAPKIVTLTESSGPQTLYVAYVPWIATGGGIVAVCCAIATYCCRRQARTAAVIAVACGGLLATQVVTSGHDVLSPWYSGYHLAREIKPDLVDGVPLYSVRTYDQTLPFYTKRTAILVEFRDEMDYGLSQEPQLWLPDIASFERAWRERQRAIAVMEPDTYAELMGRGLPMEIVARDLRRIAVRKPGTAP